MEESHQYFKVIVNDPRYKDEPKPSEFPHFESLKMTIERTLPYWNEVIVPQIKEGKRILIAAHGTTLRGIVKYLDNMFEKDMMTLNLPTGVPFIYELDDDLKPVVSLKFLRDEETIAKTMAVLRGKEAHKPNIDSKIDFGTSFVPELAFENFIHFKNREISKFDPRTVN